MKKAGRKTAKERRKGEPAGREVRRKGGKCRLIKSNNELPIITNQKHH